ncbi:MAG: hypothetical protein AUJ72_00835 [Candidatus Omnitrophica bacterium CG1_02_46_14]|nr:MAG: hypothetical protein AUJ72_00835 [Candidatus Omnitrophica bacterium CG1_02_46_14]
MIIFESLDLDGKFSIKDMGPHATENSIRDIFIFEITGWSMYPVLRKGDRVELDPAQDISPRDLILYREGEAFICHRVAILDENGGIYTRTEHTAAGGDFVQKKDVVGKVKTIVRGKSRLDPQTAQIRIDFFEKVRVCGAIHFERMRRRAGEIFFMIFRAVKKSALFREIVLWMIKNWAKFFIGSSIKLNLLRGYRFVAVPRVGTERRKEDFKTSAKMLDVHNLVLVARLAGRCAATFEMNSEQLWVHPNLEKLGIEEMILQMGRTLRAEIAGQT